MKLADLYGGITESMSVEIDAEELEKLISPIPVCMIWNGGKLSFRKILTGYQVRYDRG